MSRELHSMYAEEVRPTAEELAAKSWGGGRQGAGCTSDLRSAAQRQADRFLAGFTEQVRAEYARIAGLINLVCCKPITNPDVLLDRTRRPSHLGHMPLLAADQDELASALAPLLRRQRECQRQMAQPLAVRVS